MSKLSDTIWANPLGVALLALVWAAPASADCAAPPNVIWSYPDAETGVVPTSTRLWVLVPSYREQYLSVLLDGERIRRVNAIGSDALARAEYAPNQMLAPGEHELVLELREADTDEPFETRTIPFVAEDRGAQSARAEIASVTRYDWQGPGPRSRSAEPFPPAEAYEGDCSERVIDTSETCYDTFGLDAGSTRVELASNGEAIAYLIGDLLVPGDCRVFFPWGRATASGYPLTQVLPEGAVSARSFEGEVEVIEGSSEPNVYQDASGWCSLSRVGGTRVAAPALLGALALGIVAVSRRRTRPTG